MELVDPNTQAGNSVKIHKEKVQAGENKKDYCRQLVKTAGLTLVNNNPNMEYLGSFTVHMLAKKDVVLTKQRENYFVAQMDLQNVPEGMADVAHKQLKIDLMKSYGRDQPATIKR